MEPNTPAAGLSGSARKAIGTLTLFLYIPIYIGAAAFAGDRLNAWPWAALPFYAVAGIVWIVPLRPLFRWMNAAER